MDGTLPRHDSETLMHITELLSAHLDRLYWELSRRDALEGQHLKLKVGDRCQLKFWVDADRQFAQVEWVRTRTPGG